MHTPGPWRTKCSDEIDEPGAWDIRENKTDSSTELLIATAWKTYGNDENETHANANLIAAAPDLLEACKRALFALTSEEENEWPLSQAHPECPYHFLFAAIRKAEGQL